jgi:hypothetical protein
MNPCPGTIHTRLFQRDGTRNQVLRTEPIHKSGAGGSVPACGLVASSGQKRISKLQKLAGSNHQPAAGI